MSPHYTVDIWYAEHLHEGDKFYKVLCVKSPTRQLSFAIYNYGPRSIHVRLDNVSTGQGDTDVKISPGLQAGLDKKVDKASRGYTRNTDHETILFNSHGELKKWAKDSLGAKWLRTAMAHIDSPGFRAIDPQDVNQAVETPAVSTPSTLHEHKDYGTW